MEFNKSNNLESLSPFKDSFSSLNPHFDSQGTLGADVSLLGSAGKWRSMSSSFDPSLNQYANAVTSGEQELSLQLPSSKDSYTAAGDPLTGVVGTNPLVGNQGDKLLWGGSNDTNAGQATNGIVFIDDSSVQDYQSLIAGIKPGTEVAILDSVRNEVEQIGQYLAGRSGISSLHIVSHGNSGSLHLGGTKLGLDTLNNYSKNIQDWGKALKPGGDILLYGCDVAAGEQGTAFVQQLSRITGADVAASNDLTGNAALGGDWDLEVAVGQVQTLLAFQSNVMGSYSSTLANPVLNIPNETSSYIENSTTTLIAPALTITDADGVSSTLDGARVAIANNFNVSQDQLAIQGQSGTSGTISGINWSYNVNQGILTFSGTATISAYESVLQSVTYLNTSENPTADIRNIQFSLGGNVANPTNQHFYEFVTQPNISWTDAQTAAAQRTYFGQQGYLVTITSNEESNFVNAKVVGEGWIGASDATVEGDWRWVTGPEAGQQFWQGIGTGSPVAGRFNNWASGEPNNAGNEDYAHLLVSGKWNDYPLSVPSIRGYMVEYGGLAGDPSPQIIDSINLSVTSANDTPTLVTPIADQTAQEDSLYSFQVNANTFSDVDTGDTLTYSATLADGTALPSWLTFDAATRTFSGTPLNSNVGTLNVNVIATDSANATASDSFTLSVSNTNDAPTLVTPIADQTATEDSPFSFQVNANTFDVDAGDTLTYTATVADETALPSWLTFDAATRTFSGTPLNSNVGTLNVNVIATDSANATASDSFTLSVSNINDAPTVTNAIADQTTTEDSPFSFQVNANTFSDVDAGDTLTYTATLADETALPSWLTFDTATRTFSGTPLNGDVGSLNVNVIATDSANTTATDSFTLSVSNINDAPIANSDVLSTLRAQPITISRAELLANDTDIDRDDILSISDFTPPTNGTLVDNGNDTFTYTPSIYFDGTDSFTYTISDGQGGTANSLVNLTVNTEDGIFNQVQLSQFLNTGDITNRDLNSLNFDEGFYLEHNPDVAQAVALGAFQSGFEHFLTFGQAEGRDPSILFNEDYYLTNNQDVDDAVKAGAFRSGYDHFLSFGIFEGRNSSRLFDNSRYLTDNQDVGLAVEDRALRSGFEHFLRFGQFEGRQPKLELFDEEFYLRNNSDVADAVKGGAFQSGFEHFIRFGQVEGRNPSELFDEEFYLRNNSDVADAVKGGAFRSGFEHFIRFGRAEGRSAVGDDNSLLNTQFLA